MSKDFHVAIVGGGIGGLSLAIGLIRGGMKVDIFEQAPKFEEIGAGVGIGPNGIRALSSLGILDAVLERAKEPLEFPPFLYYSGLSGHEEIHDQTILKTDIGMAVHRAFFLDILISLIPPGIAHFKKKCISVTQLPRSKGVSLVFEDGTTHTTDLLIGCDGIKSLVRRSVVNSSEDFHAKFTRTVAYRGLIHYDNAITAVGPEVVERPCMFLETDRHIVIFPLREQKLINVVVFYTNRSKPKSEQILPADQPWVIDSSQDEMLAHYNGCGPKVMGLLRQITTPRKWFLHSIDPPLSSYVKGRIALLGDAAHSMLPHLGAGAGQAMEDAMILSQLLIHPATNIDNLELVIQAYDQVRRPRANSVVTGSEARGEVYERRGPSGPSFEEMHKDLDGGFDFVWYHDLDKDIEQAVKILQDKQVFPCVG